jgi:plastocyanin
LASRHLALPRMPRPHAVPSTAAASRPRAAAPVAAVAVGLAATLAAALAPAASAQTAPAVITPPGSVAERSPNMFTNWVIDPGTVQFNFLHRFTESGAPAHQIDNVPTFHVAAGLPWRTMAGFAYSTSSEVAPDRPNEWEFFGRLAPLARNNRFADLALHVGYNLGAASTDGELSVSRRVGPLRLQAAGRAFSNAFRAGDTRTAVAGGATLRLNRFFSVAGDYASLLDKREGEREAWSAGLNIGIPNTPHSFSLHASNTNTATLQGASKGYARTRYGFEYTVPITLSRYVPAMRTNTTVADAGGGGMVEMRGDTARINMTAIAYEPARIVVKPGTVVVFTNNAPLQHTVTADDNSYDSGLIDGGRRWTYKFDNAGSYPFHCTPHPFMKGVVVVR